MCLDVSYKKKIREIFLAPLKSLKKGVRSGNGSRAGSVSQRYGSRDRIPQQKNVTDPQHL
jgi:hypothetical protein